MLYSGWEEMLSTSPVAEPRNEAKWFLHSNERTCNFADGLQPTKRNVTDSAARIAVCRTIQRGKCNRHTTTP
jgi:hypothetical protein